MSTDGADPHLLGPVTLDSPVQRREGVLYTEVDGQGLLCDTGTRTHHVIGLGTLALWCHLDGKPLRSAMDEAAVDDGSRPQGDEAVEVVRRLRAVGLAEDADGDRLPAPAPDVDAMPASVVHVDGRGVDVMDPEGLSMRPGTPLEMFAQLLEAVDEADLTQAGIDALAVLAEGLPSTADAAG